MQGKSLLYLVVLILLASSIMGLKVISPYPINGQNGGGNGSVTQAWVNANFVPYNGASQTVNLGSNNLIINDSDNNYLLVQQPYNMMEDYFGTYVLSDGIAININEDPTTTFNMYLEPDADNQLWFTNSRPNPQYIFYNGEVDADKFVGNGSLLTGVCLSDGTNCNTSGNLSGYVPYQGATEHLNIYPYDLRTNNINAETIQLGNGGWAAFSDQGYNIYRSNINYGVYNTWADNSFTVGGINNWDYEGEINYIVNGNVTADIFNMGQLYYNDNPLLSTPDYGNNWYFGSEGGNEISDISLVGFDDISPKLHFDKNGENNFAIWDTTSGAYIQKSVSEPISIGSNSLVGIRINGDNSITFPTYTSGYLKSDSSGNIGIDNNIYTNITNNITSYVNTTNNITNNITTYVNTTNNITNNISANLTGYAMLNSSNQPFVDNSGHESINTLQRDLADSNGMPVIDWSGSGSNEIRFNQYSQDGFLKTHTIFGDHGMIEVDTTQYYPNSNPYHYSNTTTNLTNYALLNGSNFTGNISAPNICYSNGTNCSASTFNDTNVTTQCPGNFIPFGLGTCIPANYTNTTVTNTINGSFTYNITDPYLIIKLGLNNNSTIGENSTLFVDSAGHYNATCSISSCPTVNTTGIINNSYTFNGVNNFINTSNNTLLNNTDGTIAFWVNLKSYTSYGGLIISRSGTITNNGLQMGDNTDGTNFSHKIALWKNGGAQYGTTLLNLSQWYHIVYTENNTGAYLYVNGILDGSKISSGNLSVSNAFTIGEDRAGYYLNGSIDEIRFYNRTLNITEIQNLYNLNNYENYSSNATYVNVSNYAINFNGTITASNIIQNGNKVCDASNNCNYANTSINLTSYSTLNGSNQPFTGDINITKSDPTFTLVSTDDTNYTTELKRVSTNREMTLKNYVGTPSSDGTGGVITHSGSYTIHTFTSNGTFTPPAGVNNITILIVGGGGGGGGFWSGGGGGGGGVIYNSSYPVTTTSYSVTVGNGGTGGVSNSVHSLDGQNSVFNGTIAIGGGGGGTGSTYLLGDNGGSGGGAGGYQGGAGAYLAGGNGTVNQGYNGGGSCPNCAPAYGGGGGGGAGLYGTNGSATLAGNGGIGLNYSINGSNIYYGGGGGGGRASSSSGGTGGNGGGGAGGGTPIEGTNGTGGGGGAKSGADGNGANGGSGIVIIQYIASSTVNQATVIDSKNGINAGEKGINTFGDSSGRTVIDGMTLRFNLLGTEQMQLNSIGLVSNVNITAPNLCYLNGTNFTGNINTTQNLTASAITTTGNINTKNVTATSVSITMTGTTNNALSVTGKVTIAGTTGTGSGTGSAISMTSGNGALVASGTGGGGGGLAWTSGDGGNNIGTTGTLSGGLGGVNQFTSGAGGSATGSGTGSRIAGNGGAFTFNAGSAGTASGGASGNSGGAGGQFNLQLANGGTASTGGINAGGLGGVIFLVAGNGGASSAGTTSDTGGLGGDVNITSGNGGQASGGSGTMTGGNAGNINLKLGIGGTGTINGTIGNFNIIKGITNMFQINGTNGAISTNGTATISKTFQIVCDVDLLAMTKKYQNFTYTNGLLTSNTTCS